MSKTIKYVGFYDVENSRYARQSCLAAVNKMNYLIEKLNQMGYSVHLVSPSWYVVPDASFTKKKEIIVHDNLKITFAPSFPTRNRYTKYLKILLTIVWLFFYLLCHVHRNEEIIVYHSPAFLRVINLAKSIKGFKVILEVEEIYTNVGNFTRAFIEKEMRFIASADKYFFSTELLEEKLNPSRKPYAIYYGVYKAEMDRGDQFDDDKIHLVYAGTFCRHKKGAYTAVATACFLDEKYHLHILGFGSPSEIKEIQTYIQEVQEKTACTISYDGLLSGENYIRFLQKCDVGLSTQTPVGVYNETSFPSKILPYLANGLRVVTIDIEVVRRFQLSNILYCYKTDNPSDVANVIKEIHWNGSYDSREAMNKLDEDFEINLSIMLRN